MLQVSNRCDRLKNTILINIIHIMSFCYFSTRVCMSQASMWQTVYVNIKERGGERFRQRACESICGAVFFPVRWGGGGRGRWTREKRHSFTSSLPPPGPDHDQWAGIPLFTLLKIDSTHCDDVASRDKTHPLLRSIAPPPPPPIPPSHPDRGTGRVMLTLVCRARLHTNSTQILSDVEAGEGNLS